MASQFQFLHAEWPDVYAAATKAGAAAYPIRARRASTPAARVPQAGAVENEFWQMVGRGTRLRKDLFGPGKDKAFLLGESLGKRLFRTRLELVSELDRPSEAPPRAVADRVSEEKAVYGTPPAKALRQEIVTLLHAEVAAMNLDNFIVRPKRMLVEKYAKPEAWATLKEESLAELAHEVAGLPSEQEAEDEEAKRFDMLLRRLQLAMLRVEPAFRRLSEQLKAIAGLLEEKASIPMVQEQVQEYGASRVTVVFAVAANEHLTPDMKKHSILWALAIIVGAGVLGMAGVSRAGHGQTPTAPAAPAVALGDLHVPAGFKVSVFASDLAGARMMTVSPEGVLLVACRRTNEVVALPTRTTKALSIESRTAESDDTDSCAM